MPAASSVAQDTSQEKLMPRSLVTPLRTAPAACAITGGLALTAQAADASYAARVDNQTLTIKGNEASDILIQD
jgi:hypothetical protein